MQQKHRTGLSFLSLKLTFCALALLCLTVGTFGQQNAEQKFSKEKWRELTKDLDYSGAPLPDDEEERMRRDSIDRFGEFEIPERRSRSSGGSLFGAGIFKIFAIIFLVAVLAAIMVFFLKEGIGTPNEKIKQRAITLENIEENIHETDLERFIREAKEKGDFALAMRLYYLAVIKELSLKKIIKWKRDKTNGEYLRELRTSEYFDNFREITNIFERIWYGGGKIDQGIFEQVEPKFQSFVNLLQKKI